MRMKVRMTEQNIKCKPKMLDVNAVFVPCMKDIQTIPKPIGEPYRGEYEVNPSFEPQTLPTENKFLSQNITIDAIVVSRVTNPAGGRTVYIGGVFNE